MIWYDNNDFFQDWESVRRWWRSQIWHIRILCMCMYEHTYIRSSVRPYVCTYVSYKKFMSISLFMYGTVRYSTGCDVAFVFLCVNRVCSYRFIRTYIYKNWPTVVLHQDTHTDIYCIRTLFSHTNYQ